MRFADEQEQEVIRRYEMQSRLLDRQPNRILEKMTHLLRLMVYEMHSYNTPLSPHVAQVIRYVVKFFLGEEHTFGSETVLRKTSGTEFGLKEFLRDRTFFRREVELDNSFKSDQADKNWHQEQKNKAFLDKSNYWCDTLYSQALKIYNEAITETGKGKSCYPVINDYINNVTHAFEPNKIFSK